MKRFLLLVGWLIGGVVCAWALTVALILFAGARPSLRHADAILVLGAAQYNGRPSPVLKARLDHAIRLFEEGYATHIIFTGGVGVGDTVSEGEVARRYAIEQGIADSSILVDREGATSAESVDAAALLMHERGWTRALLVSDSYHMLRLELLARRAGITPYRAPAPQSPIDRDGASHRRYVLRESLLLPAQAILGAH